MIVEPFSTIAIAKKILDNLSRTGPLSGYLEEHFYDTKKIKTSSIVSYGLNHIVKTSGTDSFFHAWTNPRKNDLVDKEDRELLELYIEYCTSKIRDFIAAFRKVIDEDMWTLDKKKKQSLNNHNYKRSCILFKKID